MALPNLERLIATDAARYRLPEWVLAGLVRQESGGNPRATSPAGAQGLTQLMPATARGLGVTDPYDPAQNLDAGARYLRAQVDRFGSIPLALAAYNAGPGAVEKYHGVPPYAETQRYVAAITRGKTGGGLAGAASSSAPPTAAAAGGDSRRAFAARLLAAISPTGQLNNDGLVGALQAFQPAAATPSVGAPYTPPAVGGGGGIAELLKEGTGGPTHSTGPHVHAAFTSPQLELAAIGYARQLGLHVGENPYVGDTVDPVHATGSYHYRDFPGTYNGRRLGEAIDVSGPQQDAFYGWLAKRRGGR